MERTHNLECGWIFNATDLAVRVRASSAIPGIFDSVIVDGEVHSDGQVVMGINVFSAVQRCQAAGYADDDIVIDVITANSDRLPVWDEATQNHATEIKARAVAVQAFSMEMADILDACRAYPEVNWRYFVQAPSDLPGSAASFNTEALTAMTQFGLSSAANASVGIHCAHAENYRHSKIIEDLRRKTILI